MKKTVQILAVLILLVCLISVAFTQKTDDVLWGNVLSYCFADVDMDGQEEMLTIETQNRNQVIETGERYGNYLRIYDDFDDFNDGKDPRGTAAYEFDLSHLKPLLVQAGDVNHDGKKEISVIVYKETEFHPVPAKRPFFYALTDGCLEKIWLGSRLSRPFTEFILCDMDQDGADEIVSLEKTREGETTVALYQWAGFGFDMVCESEPFSGEAYFTDNRIYTIEEVHIMAGSESFTVKKDGDRLILQKNQ